jgi:hypothetical protein
LPRLLKISTILICIITVIAGVTSVYLNSGKSLAITVFAGDDRVICRNQDILLNDLNAYINGDVSDGDWLSFGDGRFQPGNLTMVRFSFAKLNNIRYVPGPNDKTLGFFRLMLISDFPVGNPQERASDEVRISFQDAPPLFCNSNFTVSLDDRCQQLITVPMLQASPVAPFSNYIITLYDKDGQVIQGNIVSRSHIDTEISFRLGHQCTTNICWGKFKVEDYFPPTFICDNDTIPCTKSTLPDSLGFPFPPGAKIDTIINRKYIVSNWDQCSKVTLEYKDDVVKANCTFDLDKTIIRRWRAWDAKGNLSQCNEYIVVKRISLQQVQFPPNFDDVVRPGFECRDTFPALANGHPSPDTTGIPGIGHCNNLQSSMTDIRFNLCGASFKIARSWFVIDWCTAESTTRNQIILVRDSKGPELICQDTIRVNAGAYTCATPLLEVPAPSVSDECSDFTVAYNLKDELNSTIPQYLKQIQGKLFIDGLPLGKYTLEYLFTDQCNNISQCKSLIFVTDATAPFPACDLFTKVALSQEGKARVFAQTFDDGSYDNCGISGFRVRKMSDTCGATTSFGPYVDFCCLEVGRSIMVSLEITDIHGLSNTCMVEVAVEDKIKPSVICPPNLTVSCDSDLSSEGILKYGRVVTSMQDRNPVIVNNAWHQGLVGMDGLASDNCNVSVTDYTKFSIQCHTGNVRRTFVATDKGGLKDSCTQTIHVLDPNPFSATDIVWPKNVEMDGCKSIQSDTSITGQPMFKNTSCALVSATWDDQLFPIADGACLKIVRTWTVINWCQFTGIGNAGKYGPYVQLIKLHNTDKPVFTQSCADTTFCAYDAACLSGIVTLSQSAADPCTAEKDLKWKYSLDKFADGTIDQTGPESSFTGELPNGKHAITWRVEDNCGNFNTCTRNFEIVDCKNPSVYCISSLTVSLKQATGNIQVWAKDFDKGSFDHCTPNADLKFTFDGASPVSSMTQSTHYFAGKGELRDEFSFLSGLSQRWLPDSRSSALYFDCDNIPDGKSAEIPLRMSVTDAKGNTDFCDVKLVLQDNSNHCPDAVNFVNVSGRILTEQGKLPKNTSVLINHSGNTISVNPNPQNGQYVSGQISAGAEVTIQPVTEGDPLDGLSTLDLILIQRHILGLAPLQSPYRIIAADVNGSRSVTASDLVDLRKLILGITTKFPKDMPAWLLAASGNGAFNADLPFGYNRSFVISSLQGDTSGLDFTAIKLGDVNLSANGLAGNFAEQRSRQDNVFEMLAEVETIQNQQYLTLKSGTTQEIDGLQFFINVPDGILSDDVVRTNNEIVKGDIGLHTSSGTINLVTYSDKPYTVHTGDWIVSIPIGSDADKMPRLHLSDIKSSEVYINQEPWSVKVAKPQNISVESSFSLMSNPVAGDIMLETPSRISGAEYHFRIVNAEGRIMHQSTRSCNPAEQFNISLPDGWSPGIYWLQIENPSTRQSIRFISIR